MTWSLIQLFAHTSPCNVSQGINKKCSYLIVFFYKKLKNDKQKNPKTINRIYNGTKNLVCHSWVTQSTGHFRFYIWVSKNILKEVLLTGTKFQAKILSLSWERRTGIHSSPKNNELTDIGHSINRTLTTPKDIFLYYKIILQNETVITKCDDFFAKYDCYYKMRRLLQNALVHSRVVERHQLTSD